MDISKAMAAINDTHKDESEKLKQTCYGLKSIINDLEGHCEPEAYINALLLANELMSGFDVR